MVDDLEQRLQQALQADPFAGDFGSVGDRTLRNTIVTARREHECHRPEIFGHKCSGRIAKGERHRVLVDIADGEMQQHRWCQACTLALAEDPAAEEDEEPES